MVDFSMDGPNAALLGMQGFRGAQDRLEAAKQLAIDNAMADAQAARAQQALDLTGQRMAFDQEQAGIMNERNATVFAQQDTLFNQTQIDRAAALDAEAATKARAAEAQMGLNDLYEKITAGTVSANDFAAFSVKFPELSEGLMDQWGAIAAEKKEATLSLAYKTASALKAGNPDLAIKMLDEYAVAAENSGNLQDADLADGMIATIENDPEQGLLALGMLIQGVDPEANTDLFGSGDATSQQKDYKFYEKQELDAGRVPKSFEEWSVGDTGASETGLNVVYGRNKKTGEVVALQATKDGKLLASELPPDVEIDLSIKAEEAAQGAAAGKASGTAMGLIPGLKVAVETMDSQIDSLLSDPYLDNMLGPVDSLKYNFTASANRVQSRLDQLKGQAFLRAYTLLQNGGQITEIEGQKATDAMLRMRTAVSREDFVQAMEDFRAVVYNGIAQLEATSKTTATPPVGGGTAGTGVRKYDKQGNRLP